MYHCSVQQESPPGVKADLRKDPLRSLSHCPSSRPMHAPHPAQQLCLPCGKMCYRVQYLRRGEATLSRQRRGEGSGLGLLLAGKGEATHQIVRSSSAFSRIQTWHLVASDRRDETLHQVQLKDWMSLGFRGCRGCNVTKEVPEAQGTLLAAYSMPVWRPSAICCSSKLRHESNMSPMSTDGTVSTVVHSPNSSTQ